MSNKRQAGYFGLRNTKYAMEDETAPGGWLPPVSVPFAKSLSLNTSISSSPLYGDDRKIVDVPVDKGYEGTVGLTTLDFDYEVALGYSVKLADGTRAQLDAVQLKKHCLYFETQGAREDNSIFTIKSWLLNITTAKAGKSYTTKGDNIDFGSHEMPIVVYGAPLVDSVTGENFVDEDGNERYVHILSSYPGDAGYATFGDAVPEPKYATAPETESATP